jgi:hypothetical protein
LFSLPYITILLCIFTAWTWGGVLAGGVCAVGGAILAPIAIPAALGGIGFAAAGVTAGSTEIQIGINKVDSPCSNKRKLTKS